MRRQCASAFAAANVAPRRVLCARGLVDFVGLAFYRKLTDDSCARALPLCIQGMDSFMNPLTGEDYDLIFESLRYTKSAFQNYDRYPDETFRRSRIDAVVTAIAHLRELQRGSEA
jgi:hypothetical protein